MTAPAAPVNPRPFVTAAAEAAVTALGGGVLAGAAWSLVGLGVPAAVLGAANGLIGGGRGIYRWRQPSGPLAFVLDSTWNLPMTGTSLLAHGVAALQRGRGRFVAELSRRRNRHVYAAGLQFRRGFALTLGPVVNGATEAARTNDRRRQLITDHEDVHVWQARWFGPLYPVVYGGWVIGAALFGAAVWAARRRDEPLFRIVEGFAYYANPFEWWAYSRDGYWPPAGLADRIGWRRPVVLPFSATPRALGRGRAGPSATPR